MKNLSMRGDLRRWLGGVLAVMLFALVGGPSRAWGATWAEWRQRQGFSVEAAGLFKISLPPETLDAAQAGLEDLRVSDAAGNEVPYLIQRPVPLGRVSRNAKSFKTTLAPGATVAVVETGMTQALSGVTIETPAVAFLKAVKVEGSADGASWTELAQGVPVFRLANGAQQRDLALTPAIWAFLRFTLDDRRTAAIPLTGVRIHAAEAAPVASEALAVRVSERAEARGETVLTLDLGAANLLLVELEIVTDEPLFARNVTVATREVVEGEIRERALGSGWIYRQAVEGLAARASLAVALETTARARELVVKIQNGDSPPLTIREVRARRRPVNLLALARQAGPHFLLVGNRRATAARYDLAGLGVAGANVAAAVSVAGLVANPDYREPETLPEVAARGAAFDARDWQFRRPVTVPGAGVVQLELDAEVLAHTQSSLADVRVVSDGKQVPFLFERTGLERAVKIEWAVRPDPKRPRVGRWMIKLPLANLPVERLTFRTQMALFQRNLSLFEETKDFNGERQQRTLATAVWQRTPEQGRGRIELGWTARPTTDTLFLETDNGDNPAIEFENFEMFHRVTRLRCKTSAGMALELYFGNPKADAPRYDLGLVAGTLLSAEKVLALLGPVERLKKAPRGEGEALGGTAGYVFWAALALVVVGLLLVIRKLLPAAPEGGGGADGKG